MRQCVMQHCLQHCLQATAPSSFRSFDHAKKAEQLLILQLHLTVLYLEGTALSIGYLKAQVYWQWQ